MKFKHYKFRDIVIPAGFVRGPFGSALKKSLFVEKSKETYKVYEQGVVLNNNKSIGEYYISKDYFETTLKRFEVKNNDFLVSCSGVNYGAIYHLTEPFEPGVINQALLIIRINNKVVDYNYFLYYFKCYISKIITNGTGDSTIPNFPSMEVIKDIDLYLPDIEIQQKIGNLLRDLDKKIEINNVVNNNLQQMAKTIYEYWFTQFDFPDENGKPYRSSGRKMMWNEQLKRDIPDGWIVASVADNPLGVIIKPGVTPFNTKIYYATASINGTSIGNGSLVEYKTRESRANMQPVVNSVWFAKMKKSVKHLILNQAMNSFIEQSILSTGFCGLQCSATSLEYVASFIQSDYFEPKKDSLAHGATQEAVNNDDLENIAMLIPTAQVIERYHKLTSSYFSAISRNTIENKQLIAIRNWLLPMLMNGQVSFTDKKEENPQIKVSGFEQWLVNQGFVARGDVDMDVLRDIYEAMDSDDK